MPYINKDIRNQLDRHISHLWEELPRIDEEPGTWNFAITSLLDRGLKDWGTVYDYGALNAAIGILEAVKLELYRRVVVPYEDEKLEQNGDVYA